MFPSSEDDGSQISDASESVSEQQQQAGRDESDDADILEAFGLSDEKNKEEKDDDDVDILEAFGLTSPAAEEEEEAGSSESKADDDISSPSHKAEKPMEGQVDDDEEDNDILEAFGLASPPREETSSESKGSDDADISDSSIEEEGQKQQDRLGEDEDADIIEAFGLASPSGEESPKVDDDADILEAFGVSSPPRKEVADKSINVSSPSTREQVQVEEQQDVLDSQERRGSSFFQIFSPPSIRRQRASLALLEEEKRLKFQMVKDFVGEDMATPPAKWGSLIVDEGLKLPEIPDGLAEVEISSESEQSGDIGDEKSLIDSSSDAREVEPEGDGTEHSHIDSTHRSSIFGGLRNMFQGGQDEGLDRSSHGTEGDTNEQKEEGSDTEPNASSFDGDQEEVQELEDDAPPIHQDEKEENGIDSSYRSSIFGNIRSMFQDELQSNPAASANEADTSSEGKEPVVEEEDDKSQHSPKTKVEPTEDIEGTTVDDEITSPQPQKSLLGFLGLSSPQRESLIQSAAQDEIVKDQKDPEDEAIEEPENTKKMENVETVKEGRRSSLFGYRFPPPPASTNEQSSGEQEAKDVISDAEPTQESVTNTQEEEGTAQQKGPTLFGFFGSGQKKEETAQIETASTTGAMIPHEEAKLEPATDTKKEAAEQKKGPALFGLFGSGPKKDENGPKETAITTPFTPAEEQNQEPVSDAKPEEVPEQKKGPPLFGLFGPGQKKEESGHKEIDPLELEKQKQEEIMKLLWGEAEFEEQQRAQQNLIQASNVQEPERLAENGIEEETAMLSEEPAVELKDPQKGQGPNIFESFGSLFSHQEAFEVEHEEVPPNDGTDVKGDDDVGVSEATEAKVSATGSEESAEVQTVAKGPRLGMFGSIFNPTKDEPLLDDRQLEECDGGKVSADEETEKANIVETKTHAKPKGLEKETKSALETEKERQQKLLMDLLRLDEKDMMEEQSKQAVLISQSLYEKQGNEETNVSNIETFKDIEDDVAEKQEVTVVHNSNVVEAQGKSITFDSVDAKTDDDTRRGRGFGGFGSIFKPKREEEVPIPELELSEDDELVDPDIEIEQNIEEAESLEETTDQSAESGSNTMSPRFGGFGSFFLQNKSQQLASAASELQNVDVKSEHEEIINSDNMVDERKEATLTVDSNETVGSDTDGRRKTFGGIGPLFKQNSDEVIVEETQVEKEASSSDFNVDKEADVPITLPEPVDEMKEPKSALELEKERQQRLLMELLSLDERAMKDQQTQQAVLISQSLSEKKKKDEDNTGIDDDPNVPHREQHGSTSPENPLDEETQPRKSNENEDEWESSLEPQSSDEPEDVVPVIAPSNDQIDSSQMQSKRLSALAIEKHEKSKLMMEQLGIDEDQMILAQRAQEDLVRRSFHGVTSPEIEQMDPILDDGEDSPSLAEEEDDLSRLESFEETQAPTPSPQLAQNIHSPSGSFSGQPNARRVSLIQTVSSRFRPSVRAENQNARLQLEKERQQRLLLEQLNLDVSDLQRGQHEQEELIRKCVSKRKEDTEQAGGQFEVTTDTDREAATDVEELNQSKRGEQATDSLEDSKEEVDSHVLLWWRQKLRDKNDKTDTVAVPSEASVKSEIVSDLGSTLGSLGSPEDVEADPQTETELTPTKPNEPISQELPQADSKDDTPTKSNISPCPSGQEREMTEGNGQDPNEGHGAQDNDVENVQAEAHKDSLDEGAEPPQGMLKTTFESTETKDHSDLARNSAVAASQSLQPEGADFADNEDPFIDQTNSSVEPSDVAEAPTPNRESLDERNKIDTKIEARVTSDAELEGATSKVPMSTPQKSQSSESAKKSLGTPTTLSDEFLRLPEYFIEHHSIGELKKRSSILPLESAERRSALESFGTPTTLPDDFLRLPEHNGEKDFIKKQSSFDPLKTADLWRAPKGFGTSTTLPDNYLRLPGHHEQHLTGKREVPESSGESITDNDKGTLQVSGTSDSVEAEARRPLISNATPDGTSGVDPVDAVPVSHADFSVNAIEENADNGNQATATEVSPEDDLDCMVVEEGATMETLDSNAQTTVHISETEGSNEDVRDQNADVAQEDDGAMAVEEGPSDASPTSRHENTVTGPQVTPMDYPSSVIAENTSLANPSQVDTSNLYSEIPVSRSQVDDSITDVDEDVTNAHPANVNSICVYDGEAAPLSKFEVSRRVVEDGDIITSVAAIPVSQTDDSSKLVEQEATSVSKAEGSIRNAEEVESDWRPVTEIPFTQTNYSTLLDEQEVGDSIPRDTNVSIKKRESDWDQIDSLSGEPIEEAPEHLDPDVTEPKASSANESRAALEGNLAAAAAAGDHPNDEIDTLLVQAESGIDGGSGRRPRGEVQPLFASRVPNVDSKTKVMLAPDLGEANPNSAVPESSQSRKDRSQIDADPESFSEGSAKENIPESTFLPISGATQLEQPQPIDAAKAMTETSGPNNVPERVPVVQLELRDNHLLVTIDGDRVGGTFDLSRIQGIQTREELFADIQRALPGVVISSSQGSKVCIRLDLADTSLGFKVEGNRISLLSDQSTFPVQNVPWDQIDDEYQSMPPQPIIDPDGHVDHVDSIETRKQSDPSPVGPDSVQLRASQLDEHADPQDEATTSLVESTQEEDPPKDQYTPFDERDSFRAGRTVAPFDERGSFSARSIVPFDERESFLERTALNGVDRAQMELLFQDDEDDKSGKENNMSLSDSVLPTMDESKLTTPTKSSAHPEDIPDLPAVPHMHVGYIDDDTMLGDYSDRSTSIVENQDETPVRKGSSTAMEANAVLSPVVEEEFSPHRAQQILGGFTKEHEQIRSSLLKSKLDPEGSNLGTGTSVKVSDANRPRTETNYLARYISARKKAAARAKSNIEATLGGPVEIRPKREPSEIKMPKKTKAKRRKSRSIDKRVFSLPGNTGAMEPEGIRISKKVKPRKPAAVVSPDEEKTNTGNHDTYLSDERAMIYDARKSRRNKKERGVPEVGAHDRKAKSKSRNPKFNGDRTRRERDRNRSERIPTYSYSSDSFGLPPPLPESGRSRMEPYIWNQKEWNGWQQEQLGLGFGRGQDYHEAPGVFFYEDSAHDQYLYPPPPPPPNSSRSRYHSPYLNNLSKQQSYNGPTWRSNQRHLPSSKHKTSSRRTTEMDPPVSASDRKFQRKRIKAKMERLKTTISKMDG